MKKSILIITSLFIIIIKLEAQEAIDLFYKIKAPIQLKESDYDGNEASLSPTIPVGAKFTIVNTVDGGFVIRFWAWGDYNSDADIISLVGTSEASDTKTNAYKVVTFNYDLTSGQPVTRYFKITDSQLRNFAEKLASKWEPTYGTLILPVKLRFSPSDFTKDLTVSGTGGAKWNFLPSKELSLSFIAGAGISSVTVDSSNTEGNVLEESDRAALTFMGGAVIQWKALQIGVFCGADWLTRKNEDNWDYHGKPWLGFGIGISLFSSELDRTSEGDN